MKVIEGKIIEATETELYKKYLDEEYYEIYSFTEFLQRCEAQGVTITAEASK